MTTIMMIDAPPCTGTFRARCVRCKQPCHPHSARRTCSDGHPAYRGRGHCSRCYMSAYHAGAIPTVSLVRAAKKPCHPRTSAPVQRRAPAQPPAGLISAPCSRCGTIARLPYGPGDALCGPCLGAETLDRAPAPPRP